MESLLQELADDRLRGWRRWYALAHASRCNRCGTFLQRMKTTLAAVRQKPQSDSQVTSRFLDQIKTLEQDRKVSE